MTDQTPVSEIMSSPVETVARDATARDIAQTFAAQNIGSLVVGENPIDGIVTEYDVVKSIGKGRDPAETTVADLMSEPVVTVRPTETVERAGERMGKNGVKKLPVTEDGRPVGIVTTTDLAHHIPNHRVGMANQPEADVTDGEYE